MKINPRFAGVKQVKGVSRLTLLQEFSVGWAAGNKTRTKVVII